MTFKELEKLTAGKDFPLVGHNEEGETVIVDAETNGEERFFRCTTLQHNDWCRVNIYWEDGTVEELFKR